MAIKKKSKRAGKIKIDLNSSAGNAFVLIGLAQQHGRQLGLDVNKIREEMTSGDYENLLTVFDKYFGDYIDLYR